MDSLRCDRLLLAGVWLGGLFGESSEENLQRAHQTTARTEGHHWWRDLWKSQGLCPGQIKVSSKFTSLPYGLTDSWTSTQTWKMLVMSWTFNSQAGDLLRSLVQFSLQVRFSSRVFQSVLQHLPGDVFRSQVPVEFVSKYQPEDRLPWPWIRDLQVVPNTNIWHSSDLVKILYNFFVYQFFRSMTFILLSNVMSTVIFMPFSVYSTFVLEEKHGFNKQTAGFFVKDQVNLTFSIFFYFLRSPKDISM